MMERLHGRNFGLVLYVISGLVTLIESSFAQKDLLSINCCANSSSTDASIEWITDYRWFPNRSNCHINRSVKNSKVYSARIFDIDSGKICYNLRTIKDRDYLIRGTFRYWEALPPTSFEVLVGVTPITLVKSLDYQVVEAIFKAKKEYIDFCLQKKEGDPFILRLELRHLNESRYLEGDSSTVLKLISRVDLGNRGERIRFPDDQRDRIWTSDETAYSPLRAAANQSNVSSNIPFKVLQTAVGSRDKLVFLHNLDAGDQNYKLFLYFLEFNSTVKGGQRLFDIYVNNEKRTEAFDIKASGSNYNEVELNITATGALNLTLAKVPNGSDFGPICNAYEIFQVQSWIQETKQEEVGIMASIRNELARPNPGNRVLTNWFGDPCLPAGASWEGVRCENLSDGSLVITKLDLASKGLKGGIPSAIIDLKYLEELNLSNNGFTGRVPTFPNSSLLSSLDVRANDLAGLDLKSTVSLPRLTKLYFGCNPLEDQFPAYFNKSGLRTDRGICGVKKSLKLSKVFIGTVAAGSALLIILAILFICFYKQRLARSRRNVIGYPLAKNVVFSIASADEFNIKPILVQNFTLEYIEAATQEYKTLIGEGGFGSVYRGTLPDGEEVAVKVRSATSTQGTREFDNELNLLSAMTHENLVPLLGYCCENDQQILVYPFMSNGSLQDRLYGEASKRKVLDWPIRLSIALGAARGLTHLHTFSGRCVIHRDVKSSNILLDHSMCAKVADFGFSKYAPQEGDSGASLEVRGTAGYLDPEYYSTQHLSAKSDVFSFGVVLLEIISGREPLNLHRPQNEWSLVEWAKPYIREQKIDEIVDPSIKGMYHAEAMWRVVEVALACIEQFSAYRPSMPDIVRELEDALIIENNASEYMKSIDSLGGSNRFSIVLDRKASLPPASPQIEPSLLTPQTLTPPAPR